MRVTRLHSAALGALVSMVLTFATTTNAATVYYWYSGGSAGSQGGAGTWDTTSYDWSTSTGSPNGNQWPNNLASDAELGGTAGAVSLGSKAINVGGVTMDTSGYSITTGTLNLGGDGVAANYTSGGGTISAAVALQTSGTWTVASGSSLLVSGAVSGGASGLTKSGAGTLNLSGAATHGTTSIYGGVLQLSANTGLQTNVYTGDGTNGTGTLVFADSYYGLGYFNWVVSGQGGVTKVYQSGANANLVVFGVSQTYTGPTRAYTTGVSGVPGLELGNGTLTGALTFASPLIDTGSTGTWGFNTVNNYSYNGTLTGSGIVQFWCGTVTVGNSNTGLTGGVVLQLNTTAAGTPAPTVIFGANDACGVGALTVGVSTASASIADVLDLAGYSGTQTTVALVAGSILATGGGTLTATSAFNVYSGTISAALGGAAGLTKSSSTITNTVVLAGNNTYTGATYVNAGTLNLQNQNAVQNSTLTMGGGRLVFDSSVGGGAFNLGGLAASTSGAGYDIALLNNAEYPAAIALTVGGNNASTIYAGVLSGAGGSLTKTGSGILTLSGACTYNGMTTVGSGTLVVNGSLASPVNVIGGVLGGSGTLSGAVTVGAATLSPGSSPATLTISNAALALSSSSTLSYDLCGTNTTAGSGINDLIQSVTALTLDGTLNVTETVPGSFLSANYGDKWTLITHSGPLTDNGLDLGTMPTLSAGLHFAIDDTTTAGEVNLVIVPEPGTLVLLAAGLIGLLAYAWRKRR